MRAEWPIQADVVAAIIRSIEESPTDLGASAKAFVDNAIIHGGVGGARQALQEHVRRNYGKRFEQGGAQLLLADLQKQRTWLAEHGNMPPIPLHGSNARIILEALREQYGKKGKNSG